MAEHGAWVESPAQMTRLIPWFIAAVLGCSGDEGPGRTKDKEDVGPPIEDDTSTPTDDSGSNDDTGWTCTDGTPHLEVGTGEEGFEPLTTGQPVTMVHGPQGGWHILGSARVWNMEPIVDIQFRITAVDQDVVVAENVYRVATVLESQCTGLFWGMYGYLDVHEMAEGEQDTPPELLAYEDLEMRMVITDRTGAEVESAIVVKGVPDPRDIEGDEPAAH